MSGCVSECVNVWVSERVEENGCLPCWVIDGGTSDGGGNGDGDDDGDDKDGDKGHE